MTFKPLTIDDQAIFRAAEKNAPQTTSDINFTNLFIWRSHYRPTWTEFDGCLCLIARPEGKEPFALPPAGPGNHLTALQFTLARLKNQVRVPVIKRAPEELVKKIEAAGLTFMSTPDRDNDDYIYLSQQLSTLSGRRMHQKKNHYNFFVNHNQFNCLPITDELLPELLAMQESWLATKIEHNDIPPSHLAHELESVQELLAHHKTLNQIGLALKIDERIEGFTLGEIVGPNTALVHLEKANQEIRGLFVALTSHFCRSLPPEIIYVNREQDLGLPGLRQSKESLKPDHLRRKFTLTPPDGFI
ncbi:MAG: hypothetical protein AMR96_04340 [Candidatus Adiutrix intracellularis]|jgi:hypothetical protein|nr:MAG: hypothetical protein AMR96_04340 [Candidatus Adiutrix intracellularis]MDR2827463.1 phosphatidylglycerol lysyltransferase domain-containing protein [Candidatus Adiutrix intracellularis]